MVYRKEHAIEAWKTFVSTGTILEDKVRPEIARSWLRCRAAGVNPWSSDFNSPFAVLPQSALELCRIGVSLTNDLHRAGAKAGALLSTVDFFKPLMLAYEHPVLLIDPNGRILGGNAGMRAYCPGWEQYSYGSQSLGAYLGKDFSVQDVLDLPDKLEAPLPIRFKKGRSRAVHELNLVRHGKVEVEGQRCV